MTDCGCTSDKGSCVCKQAVKQHKPWPDLTPHFGSDMDHTLDGRIKEKAQNALRVIQLINRVESDLNLAQELGAGTMWDENMYEYGLSLDHKSMRDSAWMELGEIAAKEMGL